ncbi:aminodeoxychorismate lyase [Cellulomonas flavigena DSM 20109]|uniref:Endolytic murein transglycosylase n=1 Tax=Cellulomonas flavigena (strain ATCC 482 / DSM 20109 / BCRC 11376 / JCM 18109 / NBRC 3775 / NCIMB 8073 / NRS 134) TaxID=446466 RepID=D5UEQ7_CELFN|nr:endolytic transglycosylase MltG [Cellulomonas flavigena]ADG74717.1 aminodeoxychorismate lyase [Cellulomonas flavigena DSM 20109]
MSNQTEWWAPVKSDESVTDLFGGERVAAAPGAPEPRRRSRSSGRKREERMRKQRRRRSVSVLVVALVLVAGAGYVVFSLLGGQLFAGSGQERVTDYPGAGRPGAPTIVINAGDTGAAIAATLYDAGIVASEAAFREAFDANPDAAGIQPGTYQLNLEMNAERAVLALLDPKSRKSMKLTIPEGWTADEIFARINEVTLVPVEELKAAASDPAAIGLPAEAGGNLEGWLFPTTYQVEPNPTAQSVIAPMVAKTVETLTSKGVPQDQWLDVLKKASLIEKEAVLDSDRPMMARVIENRLAQGWPLQIDATLVYALKKPGNELTQAELEDTSNPYNSRKLKGLPPTPIASPGIPSIEAALAPAAGDWMFWVTVNLETSETKFATTHDEFLEYKAEYQAWVEENR